MRSGLFLKKIQSSDLKKIQSHHTAVSFARFLIHFRRKSQFQNKAYHQIVMHTNAKTKCHYPFQSHQARENPVPFKEKRLS